MIFIDVATTGRSGFVIATETSDRPPGSGYDWNQAGTYSVVGKVYRTSPDESAEEWKAWLLPVAGQSTPRGQSVEALTADAPGSLRDKLQKRADEKGAWWPVPDGRCTESLEHDGERWRCDIASVVVHKAHRDNEAAVEWMSEEDFEGETNGLG